MKVTDKTKLKIALPVNLAIVFMEIIAAVMSWQDYAWGMFQFYTQDSNLLALAACAVLALYQIRALRYGSEIPLWAMQFKYFAVCCLSVTFLVVIFVLMPMMGGMWLMEGTMLYHHLLCPLAAFFGFVFAEKGADIKTKSVCIAMIPTVIYALTLIVLNLLHIVEGPYPFLKVYEQSVLMSIVWFVLIIGGAWLIAMGVFKLYRHKGKDKI